jgi:hypothetical protein
MFIEIHRTHGRENAIVNMDNVGYITTNPQGITEIYTKNGDVITTSATIEEIKETIEKAGEVIAKAEDKGNKEYKDGFNNALNAIKDKCIYEMRKLEPNQFKEIAAYNQITNDIDRILIKNTGSNID